MKRIRWSIRVSILCLVGLGLTACAPPAEQQAAETPVVRTPVAKVPITSSSQEATRLYLEGRDLADKLRFPEARKVYQQAVDTDEAFAMAHLGLANTSTTAQEFFDSLKASATIASSWGSRKRPGDRSRSSTR